MIDGKRAQLAGNNTLLKAELAVAIGQIRSRILSMGLAEETADKLITDAVGDAKARDLYHLKSDAQMYADAEWH